MNNPISFLSKLNDGGLLFLNHYLEKRCSCNVFHISPTKRLIYDGPLHDYCQQLKIMICNRNSAGEELYYDSSIEAATYPFTINESRQYLVFFPVKEGQLPAISEAISDILMPLSYYLKGLYYSYGNYRSLLRNDPEQIFKPQKDYWLSILSSQQLDPSALACAVVIDPGKQSDALDRIKGMVTNLFLHDGDTDIMLYPLQQRLILIMPVRYQLQTDSTQDDHASNAFPLHRHHALLEERFGCGFRIAVGGYLPLEDIYTSYMQALAALFYLDYFRKDSRLVRFMDIGPSSRMLGINYEGIEDTPRDHYQFLSKYENDRSGYLLSTLRELVRCQFNYQDAAQRLHIHLNTLYYRQDKLSGLLGMELTSLEAKIILYGEMFLYDFLSYLNK